MLANRSVTEPEALRLLQHGVRGILRKTAGLENILSCLKAVAAGIIDLADAAAAALSGNASLARSFARNAQFQFENAAKLGFVGFNDRLKKEFDTLDSDPLFERLFNPSEGALDQLTTNIGGALLAAFGRTDAFDAVLGLFDRANARAQSRNAAGLRGQDGAGSEEESDAKRVDSFVRINADLAQQADLLQLTNRERDIAIGLSKIEEEFAKDLGVEKFKLNLQDQHLLTSRLQNLQALSDQADVLEEIKGPEQQLIQRTAALNALFDKGKIRADEYADGLRGIQRAALETDRSLAGGFERGLLRVEDSITNFSDQAETTIVNAFGAAEDALVQFVQTGEVDFRRLTDSILADLTRLLARQALFALLGGGGPGAAGAAAGFIGPVQRQIGGPLSANQASIVGEGGRELFVPSQPGNVIPAGPTSAILGGGGSPNITIINALDPSVVLEALASPEGQEVVFNTIRSNRNRVQADLGRGS